MTAKHGTTPVESLQPAALRPGVVATFLRLLGRVPRRQIVMLIVLMLLASVSEGIGLLLLVPLIGLVSGEAGDSAAAQSLVSMLGSIGIPASVAALLGLFVALIVARSVIQFLRDQLSLTVQLRLVDGLRRRAYAALMHAEWRWLASHRRSDHAHVLLSNIDRLGTGLNFGLSLIASLATIAAYGAVALVLSPLITGIVAVNAGIVFALLSLQRQRALALGQKLTAAKRAMFSTVDESLAGAKLTKILGNEDRSVRQFDAGIAEFRQQTVAYMTSLNLSRSLFQVGAAALLALYAWVGLTVWRVAVPELLTLILLFARVVPMVMAIQQTLYHWLHAMPAVHEVETLLAETQEAAEPEAGEGASWPLDDELRLDGITLNWGEDRERAALDGISLVLPARTTLAVIGTSGSGKSTLADVIMGLLVADAGTMRVDGRVVAGPDRIGWRQWVAYVPQDVFLFHDSIRANLAWGQGDEPAGDAAMADALRRAAADFVFDLPLGLDTIVGDGGQRLSGGERQRIALARALLRKPSLLILDEATSALDVENELRIRDAIERLHGDLTVIVIGHRLPTLDHADQVIRLEAGRVVAAGSWADVATKGAVA